MENNSMKFFHTVLNEEVREVYRSYLRKLSDNKSVNDLLTEKIEDICKITSSDLDIWQIIELRQCLVKVFESGFECARDTLLVEVDGGYALYAMEPTEE